MPAAQPCFHKLLFLIKRHFAAHFLKSRAFQINLCIKIMLVLEKELHDLKVLALILINSKQAFDSSERNIIISFTGRMQKRDPHPIIICYKEVLRILIGKWQIGQIDKQFHKSWKMLMLQQIPRIVIGCQWAESQQFSFRESRNPKLDSVVENSQAQSDRVFLGSQKEKYFLGKCFATCSEKFQLISTFRVVSIR